MHSLTFSVLPVGSKHCSGIKNIEVNVKHSCLQELRLMVEMDRCTENFCSATSPVKQLHTEAAVMAMRTLGKDFPEDAFKVESHRGLDFVEGHEGDTPGTGRR